MLSASLFLPDRRYCTPSSFISFMSPGNKFNSFFSTLAACPIRPRKLSRSACRLITLRFNSRGQSGNVTTLPEASILCCNTSLLCFKSASLSRDCAFPYNALGLFGYLFTRPSNFLSASPIWPLSKMLCALSSSFAMDLSKLLVIAASGSCDFSFLAFFFVLSVGLTASVSTVCVFVFCSKFKSCWCNALTM